MPVFSKSFSSPLPGGYEKPSTYAPVHKQNSDHEEPEGIDRFVSGLTDAKQWAFVGGLHVLGNVFGSKGARFFAKHKLSASLGHVLFDEVGTGVLTASLRGPEGLLIHIVRDVLEGLATRGVLIGGARFIPGLKAFRILLQPLLLGVSSYVFQGIGDRLANEKTQQKFSNHLWDMAAVFVQGGVMGKAPMLFQKGKQLYQNATPDQRKLAGFTAGMAVGVASGAISASEALMASGLAVGMVKTTARKVTQSVNVDVNTLSSLRCLLTGIQGLQIDPVKPSETSVTSQVMSIRSALMLGEKDTADVFADIILSEDFSPLQHLSKSFVWTDGVTGIPCRGRITLSRNAYIDAGYSLRFTLTLPGRGQADQLEARWSDQLSKIIAEQEWFDLSKYKAELRLAAARDHWNDWSQQVRPYSSFANKVFVAIAKEAQDKGLTVEQIKKDVRYRVLTNLIDIHDDPSGLRDRVGLQSITVETIYKFLNFKALPGQKLRKYLTNEVGIASDDVDRWVFERSFDKVPHLRSLLVKADLPDAVFTLGSRDVSYARLFESDPDGLGLLLWSRRRLKGKTAKQMAADLHLSASVFMGLEKNIAADEGILKYHDASYAITWQVMRKVFYGINQDLPVRQKVSWRLFRRAALKTYPHLNTNKNRNPYYRHNTVNVRALVTQAMQPLPASKAACRVQEVTGNMGFDLVMARNMKTLPTVDIGQSSAADFLITFYRRFKNPGAFWLLAHPTLKEFFPGLDDKSPVLTVPVGFGLSKIWQTSLAKNLASRRLVEGACLSVLRDELGLRERGHVSLYESIDRELRKKGRLAHFAKVAGIDPRVFYLSRNPWALLAMPLYDDAGKIVSLPPQKGDDRQNKLLELRNLFHRMLGNQSDGPRLVKHYLKTNGLMDTNALVAKGLPKELAKKIQRPTTYLLSDDELVLLAHTFPEIDTTKLVEGFRKGPLALAYEMTDEGALDWSKPTGFWHEELDFLRRMPGVEYRDAA